MEGGGAIDSPSTLREMGGIVGEDVTEPPSTCLLGRELIPDSPSTLRSNVGGVNGGKVGPDSPSTSLLGGNSGCNISPSTILDTDGGSFPPTMGGRFAGGWRIAVDGGGGAPTIGGS